MTVAWIALAVTLFIASLVVHEAAHAVALRKMGIPIDEAGIGAPLPPKLVRTVRWGAHPVRLTLSPWPIMAWVRPSQEDEHVEALDRLCYRNQAWFAGAGVVANLLIGLLISGILLVAEGQWGNAAIVLVEASALWFTRRLFAAYVLPVAGIAALVLLSVSLFSTAGEPTGLVAMGATFGTITSFQDAMILAALMSFALAVVNMIPVWPLDGGRIAEAILTRWVGERAVAVFRRAGSSLAFALVAYSLLSDLLFLT